MVQPSPVAGPPEPLGRLDPAPPGPPPTTVGTLPPPPPPGAPPVQPPGPWPVVAAVLVGLWAVSVTTVLQAGGWLVDQVLLIGGVNPPGWRWPLVAVLQLVAVGLPTALLAFLPRTPAVRATGRAWFAATVALVALTALRAVPIEEHEFYLAGLIVLCVIGALVTGRRGAPARPGRRCCSPPLPASLLLLPWLWVGALGGAVETVLAVLAAAAAGWLAAGVLGPAFWRPFRHFGRASLVAVGGLAAGVALALLGAGIGQAGPQLAVLVGLPAAGFALAALLPLPR